MTKKDAVSPSALMKALKDPHGLGILMLSSEEIGWKDLIVRVSQEP